MCLKMEGKTERKEKEGLERKGGCSFLIFEIGFDMMWTPLLLRTLLSPRTRLPKKILPYIMT
jgi:hypothetical protein